MKAMRAAAFLLLLAAGCRSALDQVEDVSAKAFVQRVYDDYRNPDWQHQSDRQTKFYTAELAKLIERDRTAHPGEVGNLDFDPICACQDPGNPGELKIQSIALAPEGTHRLKAAVQFAILTEKKTVMLHLVNTGGGWRIDDTSTTDVPSLRKLLKP